MFAQLQSERKTTPRSRGIWLIRAGAIVNALLFLVATSGALYFAARNAQTAYFLIVAVVTLGVLAMVLWCVVTLRRKSAMQSTSGIGRNPDGTPGNRDPVCEQ